MFGCALLVTCLAEGKTSCARVWMFICLQGISVLIDQFYDTDNRSTLVVGYSYFAEICNTIQPYVDVHNFLLLVTRCGFALNDRPV
jgi:hypothetical protein